jgi:hypothetical protein
MDFVMQLVRNCIADMRQAGIDQWDDLYPTHATLLSDAREGTMYLGLLDARLLVGMLVRSEKPSEHMRVYERFPQPRQR